MGGFAVMPRLVARERYLMPLARTYDWQRHYETAILEVDRSRLPRLIEAAEAAIHARIKELESDHLGTAEERQAITDALNGLKVLRKETE